MDIFTTVLTRVVPVPIKPERLRVKALSKEPATNELTDDIDHLENHEQYIDSSKDSAEQQKNKQQVSYINEAVDESSTIPNDEDSKIVTDKEELILPKKDQQQTDKAIKHLDIFV
ncbi:MAG: hypothetical protein HRT53_00380 [Colwellia sp.]|nr:hypothetical protein [Colwellia sp.]